MSSDYQIRRGRRDDKVMGLSAEMRGFIDATLQSVDDGLITPERALAQIREEHAKTKAAIEAAWDEYTGSTR